MTPTGSLPRRAGAQLLRGLLMGAADVVPGVSGGTIALVLGIYHTLIDTIRDAARALGRLVRGDIGGAVRSLRQLDLVFLVPLLAGIGISFVGLASVIETQLRDNPENMAGLFFGLVAASIVVALGLFTERHTGSWIVMAVVAAAVFGLLGFQSGPVADPAPLVYFGAGALAICAMILPGISGSFILLMIGMYAAVIQAVKDLDLAAVALVGLGCVVGLSLFSSVLAWIMDRAFDTVLAALIGLMIGSLRVLWPWPNGVGIISENADEVVSGTGLEWPPSAADWVGPVVLSLIAFVAVLAVAWFGRRHEGTVVTV